MFSTETVKERLKTFGYEVKVSDKTGLAFCVGKVQDTIKNATNQCSIPEGLENIAVDMAAGEFLLSKKTFAPEDLEKIDMDYAVKQLQDGDTNTVFAVGSGCMTPEQRLNAMIDYLISYGRSEFSAFRRVKW